MARCSVPFCSQQATHRFPKNPNLRNSWLKAIGGRVNFVLKNGSRICRKHFSSSDYVQVSRATGQPLKRRRLKKSTVPSVLPRNSQLVSRRHEDRKRRRTHPSSQSHHVKDPRRVSSEITLFWQNTIVSRPGRTLKSKQLSKGTQTENRLSWFVTTELVLSDDQSVLFYTGLENNAQFRVLLSTLMPMANEIKYQSKHVNNLTVEDQFLMLLIKLRRCKPDFEIGKMFGVNKTDVSNVIITWVSFITDHWSLLDSWPNQQIVDLYMPEILRGNCPFNGVISDTVIPIEDGNFQNSVNASFSQYKLKKSLKFIAGCSPEGLIYYCLEQKLRSADNDDLPIPDVMRMSVDHNLAKSIPMEKLIHSAKTFKILASALNQIYAPLSPRIFGVCVMICSFKLGIVTVNKADL